MRLVSPVSSVIDLRDSPAAGRFAPSAGGHAHRLPLSRRNPTARSLVPERFPEASSLAPACPFGDPIGVECSPARSSAFYSVCRTTITYCNRSGRGVKRASVCCSVIHRPVNRVVGPPFGYLGCVERPQGYDAVTIPKIRFFVTLCGL